MMKYKLIFYLISVSLLLVPSCAASEPSSPSASSSEMVSSSASSSKPRSRSVSSSNPSLSSDLPSESGSSQDLIAEFDILGKYVCSNDYYGDEYFVRHHESIPSITFFEDGSCILSINYFEGGCDASGVYRIEEERIYVELSFDGTIFEGTGTEYLDDHYIFTIISDEEIIIDREFYAVEAGDPFVRKSEE